MAKQFFVTGIGTDVGKTVVSAALVKKLNSEYWKPVQAGDLDNSDSIKIKRWVPEAKVHNEQFRLTQPMSPHAAAKIDGVELNPSDFNIPSEKDLIIEGAGGLMVPINESGDTILDLIIVFKLPVILISRNYLGSINHTLLSVELLKAKGVEVAGIIFNGEENLETESVILNSTGLKCLGKLPMLEEVNSVTITELSNQIEI